MRKIGAVLNREIIDFVNGYFDTYKKSPSIRDIEAGVSAPGISPNGYARTGLAN